MSDEGRLEPGDLDNAAPRRPLVHYDAPISVTRPSLYVLVNGQPPDQSSNPT
jgi:hypothetical protein